MKESEWANFNDLLSSLKEAKDAVDAAERAESEARSRCTAATNHLNAVQKKFDAVVEMMRKEAPRQSDWGQQRLHRNREVAGV